MKIAAGYSDDDTVNFHIADMKVIEHYLFVTEVNLGIFIFSFGFLPLYSTDYFLYPLSSYPNKIHVEQYDDYEYQLLVTTVANNEVLIFEPIQTLSTATASEVLKISRIHAFLLPKYYSFGLANTLNNDFMINELYNSMRKTVSLRISSRKRDSMNDSTLKILDTNIPISSIIYLGFIDSYTNLFMVATSNQMKIYRISRPYIVFDAKLIFDDPEPDSEKHFISNYCLLMGDLIGKGQLVIFRNETSTEYVHNKFFPKKFYLNLYDPFNMIILNDIFLGSNIHLSAVSLDPDHPLSKMNPKYTTDLEFLDSVFSKKSDALSLDLTLPIQQIDLPIEKPHNGSMDLATYATSKNTLRLHMTVTLKDHIIYQYNDINFFKGDIINSTEKKTRKVHNANFITTFTYQNNTNNYLFALSIPSEESPEFHVFVISDIVSWVNKVSLLNITNDNYKVIPEKNSITYIAEQGVVIIKGYKIRFYMKYDAFFFYRINNSNLECFDVVTSDETEDVLSKFIYINEFLYYIIYQKAPYFDVYTLNTHLNKHFIEYRLSKHFQINYRHR
jgi:hypothetical protein